MGITEAVMYAQGLIKPKRQRRLSPAQCWRIGDDCNYHSRIGGPVTTTGHRIKEIGVLGGRTVAWITGKTGCVAIEALSVNA